MTICCRSAAKAIRLRTGNSRQRRHTKTAAGNDHTISFVYQVCACTHDTRLPASQPNEMEVSELATNIINHSMRN